MGKIEITDQMVADFQRDGVVLVKGLWKDWVEPLRAGIARNMAEPGPYAAENLKPGEPGRFFDDYCNWERIPEFREVIFRSDVADVASALMASAGSSEHAASVSRRVHDTVANGFMRSSPESKGCRRRRNVGRATGATATPEVWRALTMG